MADDARKGRIIIHEHEGNWEGRQPRRPPKQRTEQEDAEEMERRRSSREEKVFLSFCLVSWEKNYFAAAEDARKRSGGYWLGEEAILHMTSRRGGRHIQLPGALFSFLVLAEGILVV